MAKKLVINTQYLENYADEGMPAYWKAKGGSTYVVEGITNSQELRIAAKGIPHLELLLNVSNDYVQEYVLGYDIVDSAEEVYEEWETKNFLSYNSDISKWVCRSIRNIDYMLDIDRVIETYEMEPAGKRSNFTKEYRATNDGNWYSESEIMSMREVA